MERPNHAAIVGRIAKRFAKLSDERRKARLGDVNARPQRRVKRVVRDSVRLVRYQNQEQIERFWWEVDLAPAAAHDSSAGVDHNRAHYPSIMPN